MAFNDAVINGLDVQEISFSTALEASRVVSSGPAVFKQVFGKIDATAGTDVYYIQVIDKDAVPDDGAVTLLCAPLEVNHTSGTSTLFSFEVSYGIQASTGIVVVASTDEFEKEIATSNVMSINVLYR